MKEHEIKDKVLAYLIANTKGNSIRGISHEIKIDDNIIRFCVDDIIKLGLVEYSELGYRGHELNDKILTINHRGRFFLNQSGGFSKLNKQEKRTQMWIIAKTTSAILNAIAILFIGVWGIKVADKSNKVENMEAEIQVLKHKNDSLINETHFLLWKLNGQNPRP